jgi:hypothetical protein
VVLQQHCEALKNALAEIGNGVATCCDQTEMHHEREMTGGLSRLDDQDEAKLGLAVAIMAAPVSLMLRQRSFPAKA